MSLSSLKPLDLDEQNKNMPKNGDYFISTSYVDKNINKSGTSVYQYSKDGNSHILKPIMNFKNSYWPSDHVYPFSVDIKWFGERKIEVISEDQARDHLHREFALSSMIKQIGENFHATNMFKYDVDIIGSYRPIENSTHNLKIAKLNNPVIISFKTGDKNRRAKITHVSNIGELITGISGGVKAIPYTDLNAEDLGKAVEKIIKSGFASKLESTLTNKKKIGKRQSLSENNLSL